MARGLTLDDSPPNPDEEAAFRKMGEELREDLGDKVVPQDNIAMARTYYVDALDRGTLQRVQEDADAHGVPTNAQMSMGTLEEELQGKDPSVRALAQIISAATKVGHCRITYRWCAGRLDSPATPPSAPPEEARGAHRA